MNRPQQKLPKMSLVPNLDSARPIMLRDLDGKIYFWNSSAEEKYGWNHRKAIGHVSHSLLSTVFPEPLDIINHELLRRGSWTGTLIHTRADGTRVKVASRWELFRNDEGELCTVLEVNDRFLPLEPNSAHLVPTYRQRFMRAVSILRSYRKWWIIPAVAVFLAFSSVWFMTHHSYIPLP